MWYVLAGDFRFRADDDRTVQVGLPQTEVIRTSEDGRQRWIRVRVPIDEGRKFRIGTQRAAATSLASTRVGWAKSTRNRNGLITMSRLRPPATAVRL